VGDLLLQETASRLEASMRDSDTVARLGGDEFTVILPRVENRADVEIIAEKIFESFRKPVNIEGNEVFIACSIGIAVFPDDGEDVDALQKNADSAMYSAKQEGCNRFHHYTPQLQAETERRLKIITLLRSAIEKRELELYFQPIIDLETHEITSVEALLNWKQPELGLVGPAEFIPMAEETGLIKPIGNWVMTEVAITLRRWQRMGLKPIQIAVNKSVAEFSLGCCCEEWLDILEYYTVSPKYIIIEITESVLMSNAENSLSVIKKLRDNGMKISLDDFGTGYSSLSYLKKFPVDMLKIDRSFIKDIPSDFILVETILALADKMGITAIAEGVETEAQLDFLTGQQCRYAQGYYFSKPLPLAELEQFRLQFKTGTYSSS
jgi:predicted signal transduction protein with EAL and GGDEF domain